MLHLTLKQNHRLITITREVGDPPRVPLYWEKIQTRKKKKDSFFTN